jgi:hypothetical protein
MKYLSCGLCIAILLGAVLWAAGPRSCQPIPANFSIVLVPDSQYATAHWEDTSDNPFYAQARWIVDHQVERNIRFVIHLGDITNSNADSEWPIADQAYDILDNGNIAYSIMPGNHDYYPWPNGALNRSYTKLNSYFGPDRFVGKPWYGGHRGAGNESNYSFFEVGGLKFMVLSLEFAPTKETLCWANELIEQNRDRRVIVVTHCYQDHGGVARTDCDEGYNVVGSGGDNLWNELVGRHSNIFLMLSGHVNDSEYQLRTGLAGNSVHEILTDYQSERPCPGSRESCAGQCGSGSTLGNGWLRLLEFRPTENLVAAESISAEEGNSAIFPDGVPWFFCPDYDADPLSSDHAFQFSYSMSTPTPLDQTSGDDSEVFHDRTVNSQSSGEQLRPKIAGDSQGNFVVIWEDDQGEPGSYDILARGFGPGGCQIFSDFRVNSQNSGQQQLPALAMNSSGDFVVVWQDDADGNGKYEILARTFTASGQERLHDFRVNSDSTGQQLSPVVAMDNDGNFVVVWEDDPDENGFYQLLARGFRADGSERFHDMTVNSVGTGQQRLPAVAMDASGNFVVVWQDDQDENGTYQLLARGFSATGTERFHDKTVNSVAAGQQYSPRIAFDGSGNFVVVWQDDQNGNGVYEILARGFSATGAERFHDMIVNSDSAGQQKNPALSLNSAGNFVVAWEDDLDGNGLYQVRARVLSATGTEKKSDFTINSNSSGQQYQPAVYLTPQGNIVAAWQDDLDGNDHYQILARGIAGNL